MCLNNSFLIFFIVSQSFFLASSSDSQVRTLNKTILLMHLLFPLIGFPEFLASLSVFQAFFLFSSVSMLLLCPNIFPSYPSFFCVQDSIFYPFLLGSYYSNTVMHGYKPTFSKEEEFADLNLIFFLVEDLK